MHENESQNQGRTVGLAGATTVGLGAIVGGGIMVLAGVAFSTTGPAAIVAFAVNGFIAFLTAMSFAEIASTFPESGGPYTFAKKVLSVRAAFAVGWILWFAYIVAGVLYALGFAAFLADGIISLCHGLGLSPPAWFGNRNTLLFLGVLATAGFALSLIRRDTGGGQWATFGKVIIFAFIIVAGLIAFVRQPLSQSVDALTPFFSGGASGLFAAMGYTFIALQGFDLISAIGGMVKQPGRNIPRAMFYSLGAALVIYLPLLFLISTAGVPAGGSIQGFAVAQGDTVFAAAVERFLGPAGYWVVIIAAVLSTLSALHANLLAASRVALKMAHDRTLPPVIGNLGANGTPVMAIYASTLTIIAILFMVPDLAAAGAAASLIFLVAFALTHLATYLARLRGARGQGQAYRTPWFPAVPIAGGAACTLLGVFQAFTVPDAGGIAVIWLGLGGLLYISLFKSVAETADASAEALNPDLTRFRGKSPLVLVPVANPAHASSMIEVANALAPHGIANVLLLTIISRTGDEAESYDDLATRLGDAQEVVRKALSTSYRAGHAPEALITSAARPWDEIARVADVRRCQSLILGLAPDKSVDEVEGDLELLINKVDCDVAILRSKPDWSLNAAKRILVPVGGRGMAHNLRARLLGSICRTSPREITFATVVPPDAGEAAVSEALRNVSQLAEVKVQGSPNVRILRGDNPAEAIAAEANDYDLLILGLRSGGWRRRIFGEVALRITRKTSTATIMVARGR